MTISEIKIKSLEEHIENQDKTIKGWIEVSILKDKIIEDYRKQLKKIIDKL
tara:strand:- start:1046 stop:1198 length:153 start_codon:yes stop_codon:yes gene_type:complete